MPNPKIVIEVNDNEQSTYPTEVNADDKMPTTPKKEKSFLEKYAILEVGKNSLKTMANGTLARVGDLTGNYQLQNQINNAQMISSIAMGFAINPILGAANLGTTIAMKSLDEYISRRSANINAAYLRDITATSSIYGGRHRGRER